ncbi:MAG: transporter [Deltaproteobacteria bacterium]|nr:transporter [Deltaproteobacteria bacterium]
MLGQRGKTWLVAIIGLLSLAVWPGLSNASTSWPTWISPVAADISQSPMEAQLFGDKPSDKDSHLIWSGKAPFGGLLTGPADDDAVLRFSHDVEVRISFLYNGDKTNFRPEIPVQSPLLFKYSMDYALLPNLRVGLSGFLYHPKTDDASYFQKRYGDMVMGFGPGIKYDLGRWSFTFQSQVDTGNSDRKEGFQNWFRVWYAF